MFTKLLALTIQFEYEEDHHIIVSSFDDINEFIKTQFSDEDCIKCILIEPVSYFKK